MISLMQEAIFHPTAAGMTVLNKIPIFGDLPGDIQITYALYNLKLIYFMLSLSMFIILVYFVLRILHTKNQH